MLPSISNQISVNYNEAKAWVAENKPKAAVLAGAIIASCSAIYFRKDIGNCVSNVANKLYAFLPSMPTLSKAAVNAAVKAPVNDKVVQAAQTVITAPVVTDVVVEQVRKAVETAVVALTPVLPAAEMSVANTAAASA